MGDAGVYGVGNFSPDGRLLVSVNAREQIELWDLATGHEVRRLCCMALYGEVAFSPDGRLLAAAGHWPRLWVKFAGWWRLATPPLARWPSAPMASAGDGQPGGQSVSLGRG